MKKEKPSNQTTDGPCWCNLVRSYSEHVAQCQVFRAYYQQTGKYPSRPFAKAVIRAIGFQKGIIYLTTSASDVFTPGEDADAELQRLDSFVDATKGRGITYKELTQ